MLLGLHSPAYPLSSLLLRFRPHCKWSWLCGRSHSFWFFFLTICLAKSQATNPISSPWPAAVKCQNLDFPHGNPFPVVVPPYDTWNPNMEQTGFFFRAIGPSHFIPSRARVRFCEMASTAEAQRKRSGSAAISETFLESAPFWWLITI